MRIVEETAPEASALPIAELRAHLRLGSGFDLAENPAETAALVGYLRAAISTIEARTGKVLLSRRFRWELDDWRDRLGQPLPLSPVTAIEALEIDDGAGNRRLIAADQYALRPDSQRPWLIPSGTILPSVPRLGFVVITFRAGFGQTWAGVPPDLAQAAVMLAARFYEDRGQADAGSRAGLPFGVSTLIEKWRAVRTLAGRGGRT
ncbi:head-tail connector protein [Paracoccus pacificus]|uniref:PhiE125 gp8 family phage protein n=1 Tax=Paracoccus pacificus TaxID=1463598 RepID=A0ABW4R809_9RHOB